MPRKQPDLTGSQIKTVRANLARSASQLGRRLSECALGKLDMTPTQITAARTVLSHVLPTQQHTQVEDVTHSFGTPQEAIDLMEQLKEQIAREMTIDDLMELQGTKTLEPMTDSIAMTREQTNKLDG